jgi:hypothetical protein
MLPRRCAAVGLWAALTLSFAVLVHGVIHAAGSGAFVWDSPAHVVELASALALLSGVAVRLGFGGSRRERRRRLALVRSDLGPPTPLTIAVGALTQAAVAVLLLSAEDATLDRDRLVGTVLAGILALILSALVFRGARDRVVALLVALAMTDACARPHAVQRRRIVRRLCACVAYRLFVPNRPPPAFA